MIAPALPAIVSAQLRVACKQPIHKRKEAINKILKDAMLYYPDCFLETMGNPPLPRELTKFEKYVETLKTLNQEN